MRHIITATTLCLALGRALPVLATNGDNLIAIGPNARAMGGVGVAAPQDAISAVFANPAAMCFSPVCTYSEVNFAGTLFLPHISGQVNGLHVNSHAATYAIPAIGVSIPLADDTSRWRFGLAAYGVTGLGVDYRGTALDNPQGFDFSGTGKGPFAPLVAGEYTSLQIMKFAPSIAYQPSPKWSVGLAAHLDYALLDLRNGVSPNYSFGVQPGVLYRPTTNLSFGVTYISAQPVDFNRVKDFDGNGTLDRLTLAGPQQIGFGVGYSLFKDRLLVETDARWINWANADGYKDFGWDNQWVVGTGAQFGLIPEKLFVRAGYNFGFNPVRAHNGWDGSFNPGTGAPNSVAVVEGKVIPTYYYEAFRVIGFPAVVEHHLTLGVGYAFSDRFEINLGYLHAFKAGLSEQGTDPLGRPTVIGSTLSEDSVELGVTWRF